MADNAALELMALPQLDPSTYRSYSGPGLNISSAEYYGLTPSEYNNLTAYYNDDPTGLQIALEAMRTRQGSSLNQSVMPSIGYSTQSPLGLISGQVGYLTGQGRSADYGYGYNTPVYSASMTNPVAGGYLTAGTTGAPRGRDTYNATYNRDNLSASLTATPSTGDLMALLGYSTRF